MGLYLGITGLSLKGDTLLQWGLATHYMKAENLDDFQGEIKAKVTESSSFEEIQDIVLKYSEMSASERPIPFLSEINYCFQPDTMLQIYERLLEVSAGLVPDMSPEFAD